MKVVFYEFAYIYRYKFNAIMMYVLIGIMGYGFVKGIGSLTHNTTPLVLAYLLWSFYQSTANSVGWSFMSFAEQGTLERIFSVSRSPLSISLIYIISALPQGFIDIFYLYLVFYFLKVSPGIKYLSYLLITFVSLSPFFVGLALVFVGLFFLMKRAGIVVELVNSILVGAGIFSIGHFSYYIEKIINFVPYTYAARILFNMFESGKSGDLLLTQVRLFAISTIYFFIGVLVLNLCYDRARKEGTLGHY